MIHDYGLHSPQTIGVNLLYIRGVGLRIRTSRQYFAGSPPHAPPYPPPSPLDTPEQKHVTSVNRFQLFCVPLNQRRR